MRTALALLLVTAVTLTVAPASTDAQKGPIRVGMIVPQSGPLAANGKDMINGYELFFEQVGHKRAGREIKFIVEDDEGKPATGLTKVRGLIEGQGVHLVTGPLSAAVGYAVAPYSDSKKVPALYPIVAADDLTQRKRSPYIVRTGWASSQPSHPFGKWVHDTLKYKKIAVIAYDFAFGWEVVSGFQRTYEDAGGQIVQKLWPPLGNADFAPYVSQLKRDADAVFAQFSGADALRFAKQYHEAALLRRAGYPGEPKVRPGLRGQVQADPVVLLGGNVRGRPRAQGRARRHRRRHRERRQVFGRATESRPLGHAARADEVRRFRQPRHERVRAQGRARERSPAEHGHPHLPERLAVLDVEARRVPPAAALHTGLPTLQALLAQ